MKCDYSGEAAQIARAIDHSTDDFLMADVKAVEVSNGGDAALWQVGLTQRVVKNEHV